MSEQTAELVVYSMGMCHASVCALAGLSAVEVAEQVNVNRPTGIMSPWSVVEEFFADGTPNPGPCSDDAARRHWLLTC